MTDDFTRAVEVLSDEGLSVAELSWPLLDLLPVTGASVSAVGGMLAAKTFSATDRTAVRLDELQFDLGEGPCWDAVRTAAPVVVSGLGRRRDLPWPAFSEAAAREGVSDLIAFPLLFGPIRLGAVDLYCDAPTELSGSQVRGMNALSAVIGRRVLRHALDEVAHADDDVDLEPANPFSRRVVHQATGFVVAQLRTSPEDAHLLIQGHAFATHRSMMEVADDILERRIRFRHSELGIIAEVINEA